MTRLPTRDWYTPGERPWDGRDRRVNRELGHVSGDFGNIISFVAGFVLAVVVMLFVAGVH